MNKRIRFIFNILPFFLCLVILASCTPKLQPIDGKIHPEADSLSKTTVLPTDTDDYDVQDDYYKTDRIRYENFIYAKNIKSVQLYREGWEFSIPMISLGGAEKLTLSFDDLDGDYKTYKYTLIHCSAGWLPTDMMQEEYLNGLTDDYIDEYAYSFNTLQAYTHYSLVFPGDNVVPLISGNYILRVFLDDAEQTTVFTRRFMIAEPKVRVDMVVKRATDIDYHNYKQEVDFVIDRGDYIIDNAYDDMKVILMQNNRWDNAKVTLKPKYIKGNLLEFDYEEENVFSGGNEFRRFDIKSLRWNSEFIRRVYTDSVGYHVILKEEERSTFLKYYSEKDINGRFLIHSEDNVRESDVEAEYVWVHFNLKYDAPLIDGSLYVFGGLSDWGFPLENRMTYNYDHKAYECFLYLKQGYYNYQYIFLENGSTVGDEAFIEGMHFETENDYTLLIYNRERNDLYDRLIGYGMINTYGSK